MTTVTKNALKYTGLTVLIIAVYAGGFLSAKYFLKPVEKIRIVEKKTPVTKYLIVPNTCDEFKDCYTNSIVITPQMMDNIWISITADDKCKSTTQSFKLAGTAKINPNIIFVQYVHMLNYNNILMSMGANVSYYRILFSFSKFQVGVGGGLTITNNSAGANVGGLFQF